MEERAAERLKEAALKTDDIPGWTLAAMYAGVRVTYTWQHKNQNRYTVEALVPWYTIQNAPRNPLLAVLDDLAKQHKEWKP